MKSLFEQMGGTYTQVGDYYIPDLVLPDTKEYYIGKYGRVRQMNSIHDRAEECVLHELIYEDI